jgi:transcriptional regulator with XRE-family HTH domain
MSQLRYELGQTIRRVREGAGYTQESFADAIKVHRNYMGSVERGETNITLDRLEQIARGLGLSVGELMKMSEQTR